MRPILTFEPKLANFRRSVVRLGRRVFADSHKYKRRAILGLLILLTIAGASEPARAFYKAFAQSQGVATTEGLNTSHYISVVRGSSLRERGFLIAQYDGSNVASGSDENNNDDFVEIPVPLFDGDSLMIQSSGVVTAATGRPGNEVQSYIVEAGDTISSIAEQFGLKVDTILWANGLTSRSTLKVGATLKILPTDGVAHRVRPGETLGAIAFLYNADLAKVIDFNGLDEDGFIVDGQTILIPGGRQPAALQRRVSIRAGSVGANVDVRGYFMRPSTGRITQGLHAFNAVDMGAPCGSPLYAAAPGKLIISDGVGWNGGYGKYVKISHPNGTATLYGHMSKIYVGAGTEVERGDLIGLVGSTGRSTGCHVHFEVYNAANPFAAYR